MEYIKIGKTLKAHGLKGEVKIQIEDIFWDDFEGLDALFLDTKGQKVPFFIEYLRGEGGDLLKLEGCDDRTAATQYQFKDVYVRRSDIHLTDTEIAYEQKGRFFYLVGYTLVDQQAGEEQEIGLITSVEAYPQQEMAVVRCGEKNILVPLIEGLIVREDQRGKRLYMDLPEGLVDL